MKTNKKTRELALAGIISALSVVILVMSFFPYLDFSIPALAGCLVAILVIEIGYKWAVMSYLVVSVLSLIICVNKEATVIYVAVFGLYSILKSIFETKIKFIVVEYILKILFFNIMISVAYAVIILIFNIPFEGLEDLGKFAIPILYVLGNFVFIIYDIALTRVLTLYIHKFSGKFLK